jgi:hypothetical protein
MSNRAKKIAKMLLAQSAFSNVKFVKYNEEENGYEYSVNSKETGTKRLLIKAGGTIKVKKDDEFETIEIHVPYDITVLHDSNIDDFHTSIIGWLGDSEAVKEKI